MRNIYFPEEDVTTDDLFFICSMIERTARALKQPNSYVVNCIGYEKLAEKLSLANVMHSENPEEVSTRFIQEFKMQPDNYDVTNVDRNLVERIPTAHDMGKVYMRLIISTLTSQEDYAKGILRVYNNPICRIIDNYNGSAYYEPSYILTRSYYNGSFN